MGPVLLRDIAADLAVVFHRGPNADVDRGQHGSFRDDCNTYLYVVNNSACSTPKRTNSGVWVMARSRAAASRTARTRISVGIRSRYRMPLAMECRLEPGQEPSQWRSAPMVHPAKAPH